ncbi:MAG TPA: hypothetical protein VHX62_09035 [Solirubrobacteraceae bacterium]|nr:hypothetical protein [Solirubrobacteraceae bacterium]
MTWVETVSASFTARHDSDAADDAHRVLQSLERARVHLEAVFPRIPEDLTVVLHPGTAGLAFTNPLLPLAWLATAPAARRYVVGWDGRSELHLLAPSALRARASNVPGSAQMLEYSAACLYARRVIIASNRDLARVNPALRIRRELRWAWLLEGGARWFGGQTEHARPAIARRLREGGTPRFPPGLRDATLLGGTVIDLLAREQGERAAARFVSRLPPQGPRAALSQAFGGRPVVHTEGAWRSHLARVAAAQ